MYKKIYFYIQNIEPYHWIILHQSYKIGMTSNIVSDFDIFNIHLLNRFKCPNDIIKFTLNILRFYSAMHGHIVNCMNLLWIHEFCMIQKTGKFLLTDYFYLHFIIMEPLRSLYQEI